MFDKIKSRLGAYKKELGVIGDRAHDRFESEYERGRMKVPDSVPQNIRIAKLKEEEAKTPEQVARDKKLYGTLYSKILAKVLKGLDNPETTYKDHNFK